MVGIEFEVISQLKDSYNVKFSLIGKTKGADSFLTSPLTFRFTPGGGFR